VICAFFHLIFAFIQPMSLSPTSFIYGLIESFV